MYSVVVLIPLIAGIGAIIKRAGVNGKYIPLINLINGIILGIIAEPEIKKGFITGLYLGLSASGFTKCSIDIFKDFNIWSKNNDDE